MRCWNTSSEMSPAKQSGAVALPQGLKSVILQPLIGLKILKTIRTE